VDGEKEEAEDQNHVNSEDTMHEDQYRLDAKVDMMFWLQRVADLQAFGRMEKNPITSKKFTVMANLIQKEIDKSIMLAQKEMRIS